MAELGGLAIGMSVVFGVFVLVLLAELYYLFYWKCRSPWNMRRINSIATEFTEGGFNFSREDGLLGSLGSHSMREAEDPESLAKLFPISSDLIGSNNGLYMQDELGRSRVLFTIMEETKEDMEGEESVGDRKSTFSECPSRSESLSPTHLERHYQQQQKQLQRDAFSIGLIPQQLWHQQQEWQESRYWMATSPSLEPIDYSELPPQYGSSPPYSPCRLASLRPASPSSPMSSQWRSNYDSLPASARKESQQQSFYAVISNPMYDGRKIWSLPTDPFGTHVSSPSLLDTPPLTPMRAPLAAYSIPLSTPVMAGVSFLRNPAGSSDSSSSSICSSPSL